jgi:hypothetical protein
MKLTSKPRNHINLQEEWKIKSQSHRREKEKVKL